MSPNIDPKVNLKEGTLRLFWSKETEIAFQIMLQIMAKFRQFIHVFSSDNWGFQHTCLTLNAAWTAGRCAICAANWRFLAVAALPVGLMFLVIARADGAVSALTFDNLVNLYCKKKPYHIILLQFCSTFYRFPHRSFSDTLVEFVRSIFAGGVVIDILKCTCSFVG